MTDAPIEPSILRQKQRVDVPTLLIAAAFGLLFAYFVYQAVGNLLELPKSYEAIGLSESVPWVVLILGLVVPILIYVIAFAIALRQKLLNTAIIFLMALVTVAAFSYGIVAIHRVTFTLLLDSL